MRTPPDSGIPVKWYGIRRVYWLVAGLTLVLFTAIKIAPEKRPFVNPRIEASPYVWPAGCEEKEYSRGDEISKSCLESQYSIPDYKKYGWPRSSKRANYYRIGRDAVWVWCNSITGSCSVRRVVSDVYREAE